MLLHQMLKALDCLAFNNLIHRDVKPENILFTLQPSTGYLFQLADFGLCNDVAKAQTKAGTEEYMAPELRKDPDHAQTAKADVWSLFVTLAFIHDASGYRRKKLKTDKEITQAAVDAVHEPGFALISDMVEINPIKRASATQMLLKLYKGEGLSTPVCQVQQIQARGMLCEVVNLERSHKNTSAKSERLANYPNTKRVARPVRTIQKATRKQPVRKQKTLDNYQTFQLCR